MKINVDLYGGKSIFGGKETPIEADEIYCDCFDKCSFYKESKCLRCRSFLQSTCCKFGRNNVTRGYTSRASKYYAFKSQYTSDEVYSKLKYPSGTVAVIDNYLYMNLGYVMVRKATGKEDGWCEKKVGEYIISSKGFCAADAFIPLSDVNNELLHAIFTYRAESIMGNEITDYRTKNIPNVITELKKVAPDIFAKYVAEYHEYDIAPNYVGKYARIKTMVNGSTLKDCYGNVFTLKDGLLFGENINKGFTPFNGTILNCIVDVGDEKTYKITDNSECDENTVFD